MTDYRDDLLSRAALQSAADRAEQALLDGLRHRRTLSATQRLIDQEARDLAKLRPVPLIREMPLYPDVTIVDRAPFDAASLAQEIVAAIREALEVRSAEIETGSICFDDWAHERSRNIAQVLLGNYRIERI